MATETAMILIIWKGDSNPANASCVSSASSQAIHYCGLQILSGRLLWRFARDQVALIILPQAGDEARLGVERCAFGGRECLGARERRIRELAFDVAGEVNFGLALFSGGGRGLGDEVPPGLRGGGRIRRLDGERGEEEGHRGDDPGHHGGGGANHGGPFSGLALAGRECAVQLRALVLGAYHAEHISINGA